MEMSGSLSGDASLKLKICLILKQIESSLSSVYCEGRRDVPERAGDDNKGVAVGLVIPEFLIQSGLYRVGSSPQEESESNDGDLIIIIRYATLFD